MIKYIEVIQDENSNYLYLHLYLIFEKSSLKNQVRWTGTQAVKIQFEID